MLIPDVHELLADCRIVAAELGGDDEDVLLLTLVDGRVIAVSSQGAFCDSSWLVFVEVDDGVC